MTEELRPNRLAHKTKSGRPTRSFNEFSLAIGFGSEIIALLGLGSYIGFRLDKVFNLSPWLLLAGFSVGFIAVLYRAYWIVQALNKQERPVKGPPADKME